MNWLRIGHVSTPSRGKIWKSDHEIVMDDQNNQKIVMDEELVQNDVMDEQFVKHFVMDAKIDPKVVMDLSIFKIGGWNTLHYSNRKSLDECIDENEPWLLIGILSKDLFLRIQCMEQHYVGTDLNVKELMPLREGLHEMMQC